MTCPTCQKAPQLLCKGVHYELKCCGHTAIGMTKEILAKEWKRSVESASKA